MNGSLVRLHHVGCLVSDIRHGVQRIAQPLSSSLAVEPIRISSQKVVVAFLPLSDSVFLEFIQPDADNQYLNRMLARGTTFYHVGLLCRDLAAKEAEFVAVGARVMTRFSSEAFGGRECVFLMTKPDGQMVELIQDAEDE